MSINVKREAESSDSENELENLNSSSAVQSLKPNILRRASSEANNNNERPPKRPRVIEVDLTSTSEAEDIPVQNAAIVNIPQQNNAVDPDIVIISDSEDEAEIVSIEPAQPPEHFSPLYPAPGQTPVYLPIFNELVQHIRDWEEAMGRVPLTHRQMWLRQQREIENRRRHSTYLEPREVSARLAHTIFRLIIGNYQGRMSARAVFQRDAEQIERHTILFVFDGSNACNDQVSCVICITNFEVGQNIRRLPCLHIFHKLCVDPWLSVQWKCPICRNNLPESFIV